MPKKMQPNIFSTKKSRTINNISVCLFIDFYNCLNTRVVDDVKHKLERPSDLTPLLKAKSQELKKKGEAFLDAYITYTDDESVTHYLKALAREVPEMSKKVDLVSVSGAALGTQPGAEEDQDLTRRWCRSCQ